MTSQIVAFHTLHMLNCWLLVRIRKESESILHNHGGKEYQCFTHLENWSRDGRHKHSRNPEEAKQDI
jgi:hypothetical protein